MPYSLKSFTVTISQFNYLNSLLTSIADSNDRSLFKHVMACSLFNYDRRGNLNGFVPIASEFMRKEFKISDTHCLVKSDLFYSTGYSRASGLSREFALKPEYIEEYLKRYKEHEPLVNFITGKPKVSLSNIVVDDSKNETSSLVKEAIRSFDICFVNVDKVKTFVEESRQAYLIEPTDKLRGQYLQNLHTLKVIQSQLIDTARPVTLSPFEGYSTIQCAYEPLSTGRIQFREGGLQGAAKGLKHAAYDGIPDWHNYDLKSSQAYGFKQHFEDANLPCDWLDDYLSNDRKEQCARQVGVSVDNWKECFYSLCFGAALPSVRPLRAMLTANPRFKATPNTLDTLFDEIALSPEDRIQKVEAFRRVTAPFVQSIRAWERYLKQHWIPQNAYKAGRNREYYIRNACALSFNLGESIDKIDNETMRKLKAHLLQGLEACFIHHLTLLGNQYGFKPLGNEHDGLITLGEVPQEAVEAAKQRSGFRYAQLVIKPFIEKTI